MKKSIALLLSFALLVSGLCGLNIVQAAAGVIDVVENFTAEQQTNENWKLQSFTHQDGGHTDLDTPIAYTNVQASNGESYTGLKLPLSAAGVCNLFTPRDAVLSNKAARRLESFTVDTFYPFSNGYYRMNSSGIVAYYNEATGTAIYIVPNYENDARLQFALYYGTADGRRAFSGSMGNGFYGNNTLSHTYMFTDKTRQEVNPDYTQGGGMWVRTKVAYTYAEDVVSLVTVSFSFYDSSTFEHQIGLTGTSTFNASHIVTAEQAADASVSAPCKDFRYGIAASVSSAYDMPLYTRAIAEYSKTAAEAAGQFEVLNAGLLATPAEELAANRAQAAAALCREYTALSDDVKAALSDGTAQQIEALYNRALVYLYVDGFVQKYADLLAIDLGTAQQADYQQMLVMYAEYDGYSNDVKGAFSTEQRQRIEELYFAALTAIPSEKTLAFQQYYAEEIRGLNTASVSEADLPALETALEYYAQIESNYKPVAAQSYAHICDLAYALRSSIQGEDIVIADGFSSAASNGVWETRQISGWGGPNFADSLVDAPLALETVAGQYPVLNAGELADPSQYRYTTLKESIWSARPGKILSFDFDTYIPVDAAAVSRTDSAGAVFYYEPELGAALRLTFNKENSGKIQIGFYHSNGMTSNGIYQSGNYNNILLTSELYPQGMWIRSQLVYNYNSDGTLNTIDCVFDFYADGGFTAPVESITTNIRNDQLRSALQTFNSSIAAVPGDFQIGFRNALSAAANTVKFSGVSLRFAAAVYANVVDAPFDGAALAHAPITGERFSFFTSVFMPSYTDAVLFSKTGEGKGWSFALLNSGKASFTLNGEVFTTPCAVYEPGARADLALSFDQGRLCLYRGTQCVLEASTQQSVANSGAFTLGTVDNARMTDLRIYNLALQPKGVSAILGTPVWQYAVEGYNNNTVSVQALGNRGTYATSGIESSMIGDAELWSYSADVTFDTRGSATTSLLLVRKGERNNGARYEVGVTSAGKVTVSGVEVPVAFEHQVFEENAVSTRNITLTFARVGLYSFKISLYVNGAYCGDKTINVENADYPSIHASKNLYFASLKSTVNDYAMANIRVYNRLLTGEEIRNLYTGDTPVAPPQTTYTVSYAEQAFTVFAPQAVAAQVMIAYYYKDAESLLTLQRQETLSDTLAAGENVFAVSPAAAPGANWVKLYVWTDDAYQDPLCASLGEALSQADSFIAQYGEVLNAAVPAGDDALAMYVAFNALDSGTKAEVEALVEAALDKASVRPTTAGATIRMNIDQNIAFYTQKPAAETTTFRIKEMGSVICGLGYAVENGLTMTKGEAGTAYGSQTYAEGTQADAQVLTYLQGTGISGKETWSVYLVARSFVVYTDGTNELTVYSTNIDTNNTDKFDAEFDSTGMVIRSVNQIIKSIAGAIHTAPESMCTEHPGEANAFTDAYAGKSYKELDHLDSAGLVLVDGVKNAEATVKMLVAYNGLIAAFVAAGK